MKKIILGLGALTAVVAPVATAAQCGGSRKTVLANTDNTGTNTQPIQAVNPLESKLIVQGGNIDIRPYEEYVQLQLAKEFGIDAFNEFGMSAGVLSSDSLEKIENRKEIFNSFLSEKLRSFYKDRLGRYVAVITNTKTVPLLVTQSLLEANNDFIINDVFTTEHINTAFPREKLISVSGTKITLTNWYQSLINELKTKVSETVGWKNLNLEQFVKFEMIKQSYFESYLRAATKTLTSQSKVTLENGSTSKEFSAIDISNHSSGFPNLFEWLQLNVPFPTN